jgi:hypothetical protein
MGIHHVSGARGAAVTLETSIMQNIRLQLGGRPDVRLYRNNVGACTDKTGRLVTFGLCPGSSDLIGWRSVTVTPQMVGKRVAVFLSIEVKAPGAYTHPKRLASQLAFLDAVKRAGGLAGMVTSPEQALGALRAL